MKHKSIKHRSFLTIMTILVASLVFSAGAAFIYTEANRSDIYPDLSLADPDKMVKVNFKKDASTSLMSKDYILNAETLKATVLVPKRELLDKTKKFTGWKVVESVGLTAQVNDIFTSDFIIERMGDIPETEFRTLVLEPVYKVEDPNNPSMDNIINDDTSAQITFRPGATDAAKDPTTELQPSKGFNNQTFDNTVSIDLTNKTTGQPQPVDNTIRARQKETEPTLTTDEKRGGFMNVGECEFVNRVEAGTTPDSLSHVYSTVLKKDANGKLKYNVLNIKLMSDLIIENGGKFVLEAQTGTLGAGNFGGGAVISGQYTSLDLNGHDVYVKNGGKLISYGVVYDSSATKSGEIFVENGGKLCTNFCVEDYGGGSMTVGAYLLGSAPFIYHSTPYLTVPVTFDAGSFMYTDACLAVGIKNIAGAIELGGISSTCINFIGNNEKFLFQVAAGTKLVRTVEGEHVPNSTGNVVEVWTPYLLDYKENYAFIQIDPNSKGINNINTLELPIDIGTKQIKVSMATIHFPISPWYNIKAINGAKLKLSQRIDLLPGASLFVDQKSTFICGNTADAICGIMTLNTPTMQTNYTLNAKAINLTDWTKTLTGHEAKVEILGNLELQASSGITFGGHFTFGPSAQKTICSNWSKIKAYDWSPYRTGNADPGNIGEILFGGMNAGSTMCYFVSPMSVFDSSSQTYKVVQGSQVSGANQIALTDYQYDWFDYTLKKLDKDGHLIGNPVFYPKYNTYQPDKDAKKNINKNDPEIDANAYKVATSYKKINVALPNTFNADGSKVYRDYILSCSDGTDSFVPFAGVHCKARELFTDTKKLNLTTFTAPSTQTFILGVNALGSVPNANNAVADNGSNIYLANIDITQFGGNGKGYNNIYRGDFYNVYSTRFGGMKSTYFDTNFLANSAADNPSGPTTCTIWGKLAGDYTGGTTKSYSTNPTTAPNGFGFFRLEPATLLWKIYYK